MIKIFRLLRVIKLARKNKYIARFTRKFKMNAAISRAIQGLVSAIMVTHIFACFWFMAAKVNNLGKDTWVWRK
jgi:hypothetical protein